MTSIENAQKLSEPISATEQQNPQLINLNRLIEMAYETKKNVNEKADLWKKFIKLRDEISALHDEARKTLDSIAQSGRKPVNDAQQLVEFLEVRFIQFLIKKFSFILKVFTFFL